MFDGMDVSRASGVIGRKPWLGIHRIAIRETGGAIDRHMILRRLYRAVLLIPANIEALFFIHGHGYSGKSQSSNLLAMCDEIRFRPKDLACRACFRLDPIHIATFGKHIKDMALTITGHSNTALRHTRNFSHSETFRRVR